MLLCRFVAVVCDECDVEGKCISTLLMFFLCLQVIAGDYGPTTYEMARKTGQDACDPIRKPLPSDAFRCVDLQR